MNCRCTASGFCNNYQRRMTAREVQICRGEVLTPQKCEAYRNNWLNGPGVGIPPSPPQHGHGTELHQLIAALGVQPDESCQCEQMRLRMNAWGPAGCRDHREEILAHLRAAYKKTDWPTVLKAGALAVAQGLPLTLEGLLDLAIERAAKDSAPPAV